MGSAEVPMADAAPLAKHRYTVDVYLFGAKPYPCVICGGWRRDPRHTDWMTDE